MGNCCCPDDNKSDDNEPSPRDRLLPEPTQQNYGASHDNNVITIESTDNDEQTILSRIVQEAQESLIDVSAFDQPLEHHEYVDRSRMYATRINNEFERQIRDAIQKTSRSRTVGVVNGIAVQRLPDLQTDTQPDDAALMQLLVADFEQRLASSGIKLIGDLIVRVTGERNAQPTYLGQPGSAFVPTSTQNVLVPVTTAIGTNIPSVGLLPATSTNNAANA